MEDPLFDDEVFDESNQKICIKVENSKGKRVVTKISGFDKSHTKEVLKKELKELKSSIGCGGKIKTVKKDVYEMELQGDNTNAVIKHLKNKDFIKDENDIEKHGIN